MASFFCLVKFVFAWQKYNAADLAAAISRIELLRGEYGVQIELRVTVCRAQEPLYLLATHHMYGVLVCLMSCPLM